jgi:hypothetical protein
MAARVVTVAFQGVDARRVGVEVQLTGGEAKFTALGSKRDKGRNAPANAPLPSAAPTKERPQWG